MALKPRIEPVLPQNKNSQNGPPLFPCIHAASLRSTLGERRQRSATKHQPTKQPSHQTIRLHASPHTSASIPSSRIKFPSLFPFHQRYLLQDCRLYVFKLRHCIQSETFTPKSQHHESTTLHVALSKETG